MRPSSLLLLLSLSATPKYAVAQLIRPSVDSLAAAIAQDSIITSDAVGIAGTMPDQWRRFEQLKATAADTELQVLTDHYAAAVRCYAFQALADRYHGSVFPTLLRHIDDTARVTTFFGCIFSTNDVTADYFLNVVTPELIDLEAYKLSPAERAQVDSILLYRPGISLQAKADLLARLAPEEKHYSQVRELAQAKDYPQALLALGRFKKLADISLIRRGLRDPKKTYWALYAVRGFPDTAFFPVLVQVFEREWKHKYYDYAVWRMLYQALARYPQKETYRLFERTVKSRDRFRYQTLGTSLQLALERFPDPLFEPLRQHIRLDEFHRNELEENKRYEPVD